ncbi:unnamed protein product [Diplocarpon coronariae]|nr:hypothetical protein JHW43_009615 [Diplocarpon mali]
MLRFLQSRQAPHPSPFRGGRPWPPRLTWAELSRLGEGAAEKTPFLTLEYMLFWHGQQCRSLASRALHHSLGELGHVSGVTGPGCAYGRATSPAPRSLRASNSHLCATPALIREDSTMAPWQLVSVSGSVLDTAILPRKSSPSVTLECWSASHSYSAPFAPSPVLECQGVPSARIWNLAFVSARVSPPPVLVGFFEPGGVGSRGQGGGEESKSELTLDPVTPTAVLQMSKQGKQAGQASRADSFERCLVV